MGDQEKYPKRVVATGRLPADHRGITHYCNLKKITALRDLIGVDAYEDIERNSQLGLVLEFAGSKFTWSSKYVQHLVSNLLDTPAANEIWMLADGRPIRFSLHEFQYITQLNCGLPDPNDGNLASGDLWADMGLVHGDGPNWGELEAVLKGCKDWSLAKRKMVGLLVVLFVAVFGLHKNSRIPIFYAKLVMDPERFERHPWGRVAFQSLLKSLSQVSLSSSTVSVHGFVHVLQIWAFEYIPHLGVMCGGKREGRVPLLQWVSRSCRGIELADVFVADKKTTGENKVS